jgi:hypothetical protein
MGWTTDDGYDRMKTRRMQAAHARLAAEARVTKRTAEPHRMTRLRLRGTWFPGRAVNAPA